MTSKLVPANSASNLPDLIKLEKEARRLDHLAGPSDFELEAIAKEQQKVSGESQT